MAEVLCEQCQRPVDPTDSAAIPATRRRRVIDITTHSDDWVPEVQVVFHAACYPMGSRAYLRQR